MIFTKMDLENALFILPPPPIDIYFIKFCPYSLWKYSFNHHARIQIRQDRKLSML